MAHECIERYSREFLTNFICQMYFDRVNEEFSTNLPKNPNLVKKHLTYEICQRKFGRVKGVYATIVFHDILTIN